MRIGTHSGSFHADEALAVYMLRLLPKFKGAEVLRTRNPDELLKCDIVVDVGGKYEPPKFYDHHQREFNTTYSPSHTVTKLSSAGLIYKHYGREILEHVLGDAKPVDAIVDRIYDSFVEPVDAYDNGITPYTSCNFNVRGVTLQSIVSNLNPLWTEEESSDAQDRAFEIASQLMGQAFEAEVRSQGRGWFPARSGVQKALEERFKYDQEGRVLVLKKYLPWKGHLYDLEGEKKVLYVLYPSTDSIRIQAVAISPDSFETRKALPEGWRGLRDEGLSKVTNVPGSVFVHASGFIGGNKTFDGALAMTYKALNG